MTPATDTRDADAAMEAACADGRCTRCGGSTATRYCTCFDLLDRHEARRRLLAWYRATCGAQTRLGGDLGRAVRMLRFGGGR